MLFFELDDWWSGNQTERFLPGREDLLIETPRAVE
jgi:hypothetical protein